ncbi:hypothetical protein ILUMI_02952 [Ignelater luminosus]|uniref:GAG-pre-integrase domain-containing protein n=1 Tax=Ignelater luminosus TaxID=2038154 RepID=A0A8K0GMP4_IGNLU|nr:hypothetical protein ILUMI_02952 [Ignelater luminosus]
MAGGEERYIPLFDGNNFDNWKFRLRVLLEEKDYLECLDGIDSSYNIIDSDDTVTKAVKTKQLQDFLKKDHKCKSIITQSVADSHLEYIKDKHTAKEMWTALQNSFERKGIRNQLLLRKQLSQLKLEERGTLNSHFLTFDLIVRNLKASGATLEENDIICHLLLTLPKSYEMVITAIETIGGSDLTLDFVKGKLLDEEIKQKSKNNMVEENSTAFAGKLNYNKKKWNVKSATHNCGQEDERSECRRKEHTDSEKRDANNTVSGKSKNDSGATDHMTNTKCGEAITARKAGNVRGYLVVNGVAKRQRGLYELEIYLDTKTANANLSLHEKEDLWHKRYGYIGNESLQKIINLDMVNGIEMLNIKNTEKCETCIYDIYGPVTLEAWNGKNDSIHINESFEEEREVEVQTDEESGKVESARNTRERRRPTWFDDYDMSCLARINVRITCIKKLQVKRVADKLATKKCDEMQSLHIPQNTDEGLS